MKGRSIFVTILLLPTAWSWMQACRSFPKAVSATRLWAAMILPENYQAVGERLILDAAAVCGALSLDITWRGEKLIVVVRDEAFLSSPMDKLDDGLMEDEAFDDQEFDDETNDDENDDESVMEIDGDEGNDGIFDSLIIERPNTGVDVVELARAINAALDGDEIGLRIAETHEIEVTTPGAPDELLDLLSTPVWKAYKGFDVVTQFVDNKTKKIKTIEGRLHDRTENFVVLNIKGRMKKLKPEMVVSIKLPKAKKEKGN